MDEDWLRGEPLRHWLAKRGHLPLLGPLLAWEPSALAFSYAGLAFDLLIPFVLLQRRDWRLRGAGIAASLGFHLLNKLIFGIGVFPWMCICLTTIYLPPDWPQHLAQLFHTSSPSSTPRPPPSSSPSSSSSSGPPTPRKMTSAVQGRRKRRPVRMRDVVVTACVVAFMALQIALPLRHLLYPGDVTYLLLDDDGAPVVDDQQPISDQLQTTEVDWMTAFLSSVYTAGLTTATPEQLDGQLQSPAQGGTGEGSDGCRARRSRHPPRRMSRSCRGSSVAPRAA